MNGPLQQETIESVSIAYLKFILSCKEKFVVFHLYSMQLFSTDATISKKKLSQKTEKKPALKSCYVGFACRKSAVAALKIGNRLGSFQYCQLATKPVQISKSVPWKLLTARLMHNDFPTYRLDLRYIWGIHSRYVCIHTNWFVNMFWELSNISDGHHQHSMLKYQS